MELSRKGGKKEKSSKGFGKREKGKRKNDAAGVT